LTLSLCGTPDTPPPQTTTCVGPNTRLYPNTTVFIINNQVQGLVGVLEDIYFDNTFTLPSPVTAIGFDFSDVPRPNSLSPTPISYQLGSDQFVSPFGNIVQPNPGPYSYPYTGFLGFISNEPFDTLTLGGAGLLGGDEYTLDNLTFGDPTPEPGSLGLLALSGLGLGSVFLYRRKARYRTSK